jgi:hypothetical protein
MREVKEYHATIAKGVEGEKDNPTRMDKNKDGYPN